MDEVEDFQIAYGVDIDGNSEINRLTPPDPVTDPETKRKIIGATFIDIFYAEAKKVEPSVLLNTPWSVAA